MSGWNLYSRPSRGWTIFAGIVKKSVPFYDSHENGPVSSEERLYSAILRDHLARYRQMAFLTGPRQVGKTTVCRSVSDSYLNWDDSDDRRTLLGGTGALAEALELDRLRANRPVVALDEIHKFARWKGLLKGFFDTYGDRVRVIATGSARIEVFRRGGDSLMGRYLPYRMHPFSVGERLRTTLPGEPMAPPAELPQAEWEALWEHGGFPEPFLRREARFTRRWRSLRQEQMAREDLRDLTRVQDIRSVETLLQLLSERSGQQLVYSNLAQEIQASVDSIKRWIDLFARLHFGFLVRPWFRNVAKALRKEPKWFLRDWSGVADVGSRAETMTACHLLKATECWTDLGLGDFQLHYVRDKLKREVDFLVVRDRQPWLLVEVKSGEAQLSPALAHFQDQTRAPHALQVVFSLPFEPVDALSARHPVVVPARTFLSQLP